MTSVVSSGCRQTPVCRECWMWTSPGLIQCLTRKLPNCIPPLVWSWCSDPDGVGWLGTQPEQLTQESILYETTWSPPLRTDANVGQWGRSGPEIVIMMWVEFSHLEIGLGKGFHYCRSCYLSRIPVATTHGPRLRVPCHSSQFNHTATPCPELFVRSGFVAGIALLQPGGHSSPSYLQRLFGELIFRDVH